MKKSKIYDCFLYFQEFEILEIRLKYLYDYIDNFVIIEFNQSFSGKKKKFNLEDKLKDLSPYLDKIFYYKIDEYHTSFHQLITYLDNKRDNVSQIIKKNLLRHKHYDRNEINWVLDTYQRESIYYALSKFKIDNEDLIIISDIDEIPNFQIITDIKFIFLHKIITFKQKAFSYYLNLLSSENWYGSIISNWKDLNYQSLNVLRLDVRQNFKIVKPINFPHGGYHFTSIGSIEFIKNKITNMGHQELNNKYILSKLEKNILSGRDIFGRSIGQKYKKIEINDLKYFDLKMSKIINANYKNFTINSINKINIFSEIVFYIIVKLFKIIHFLKVKLGLKKYL